MALAKFEKVAEKTRSGLEFCLCLDALPVSHFIKVLWATVEPWGGVS